MEDNKEIEEFSIGNMHPVVQPDQILSKNGSVDNPYKEDNTSDAVGKEFEALDMVVPGETVTESKDKETSPKYLSAVVKLNKENVKAGKNTLKKCSKIVNSVYSPKKFEIGGKLKCMSTLSPESYEYNKSKSKIVRIGIMMDIFSYDIKCKSDKRFVREVKKIIDDIKSKLKEVTRDIKFDSYEKDGKNIVCLIYTIKKVEQPEKAMLESGGEDEGPEKSENGKVSTLRNALYTRAYKKKINSGTRALEDCEDSVRDLVNDKIDSISIKVGDEDQKIYDLIQTDFSVNDPVFENNKDGNVTKITLSVTIWKYDLADLKDDTDARRELVKELKGIEKSVQDEVDKVKQNIKVEEHLDDNICEERLILEIEDFDEADEETVEECTKVVFDNNVEEFFSLESSTEIDEDIKPIIETLNNKGYKTKYSCSGHPSSRIKEDKFRDGVLYNKLYSTARIVFDGRYDIEAPKYWDLKQLNDEKDTALYVIPPTFKIVDGLPKDIFYKWKDKYMNSLETWANKLPNAGEKKEDDVMESAVMDIIMDSI